MKKPDRRTNRQIDRQADKEKKESRATEIYSNLEQKVKSDVYCLLASDMNQYRAAQNVTSYLQSMHSAC